ncbi:MAG: hypothetical protein KAG34_00535 [Cocleimonas sp.]|nr:hypothetical protein [Cocleimonas sp.]
MITKQYLLPMTLFASLFIGLTACGGGSSTSAVEDRFDGVWVSECEYNASIPRADKAVTTINGNIMTVAYTRHVSQDCSDSTNLKIDGTFDIQYKGDHATSVCTAEKVDITITAAKVNGASIPSSQLAALVAQSNLISSPQYDLLCIGSNDELRRGDTSGSLDASAPDKRPTAMNMSGTGSIKQ